MSLKNNKTIVVVGFRVDKKKNFITGQAAMIELFIKIMQRNGYKVIPISLNYRVHGSSTVGKPNALRFLDYLPIFIEIAIKLILHPGAVLYISPGSSVAGSFRDFVAVFFAKLTGCKIFIQQFGGFFREFYNSQTKNIKRLINWYYSKATVITVEGNSSKNQFVGLKCYPHVVTLHNSLPETNIKTPPLPRTLSTTQSVNLFYLSNMIESKGYLDVLEALNILVNDYKIPTKAVFAGKFLKAADDVSFSSEEEAKNYFFKKIENYHLQEIVTYYPSLFGKDKQQVFSSSHFFLLPTYYSLEGAPTAILEALAYGSVPIVTKQGLILEMVNTDNSIIVNKKSPREIADRVRECITNIDKYNQLSVNAYKHYLDNYTVEAYEKKLMSIFNTQVENEKKQ